MADHYTHIYIDGTASCCNGETTLDTEWATAMSNSFGCYCTTAHVWVYVGVNANFSTFDAVYNTMLSDGHARTMSSSWGCTEFSYTSGGQMDTDHAIFNNMIGQGWSLAILTHNQGAYDDCATNTPKVDHPGSDPDAVAVGGTTLNLYNDGSFASEAAWTGPSGSCGGNAGGGGGGCSAKFSKPSFQTAFGFNTGCTNRSVPDVSLNSAIGEYTYYNGGWVGFGGTSIATPEVAGLLAHADAYLLSEGNICGGNQGVPGTSPCAPMGDPDYALYNATLGNGVGTAPNNPFHDVTSGCNGNGAGTGYCAGTGYNLATGWGSFNALQLVRAFIWQGIVSDNGRPSVSFSGAATGHWYNYDATVGVSVADTGAGGSVSGVSGFSDQ